MLAERGLGRYYDLRNGRGTPVVVRETQGEGEWLALLEEELAAKSGLVPVLLDAEGLHCSGCVWLVEETFRRIGEKGTVLTNPARGTIDLTVGPTFPLRRFVRDVEALGYRLSPRRRERNESDLVLRMGICIALAMNAMIFSVAIYAGLTEPHLYWLMSGLTFALSLAAFAVGGIVFVRSAVRGLARGLLHLDLPIAVGLVLGYAGSAYSFFAQGSHAAYFDTLTVFTALMLTGRFLRERILAKNRAQLLEDGGVEGLLTRRIAVRDGAERVEIVPVTKIRRGDTLLVSPGDVVPVASTVRDDHARIALDWITGESAPEDVARGDVVRAGASVSGPSAARFRAEESFETSALLDLLRTPTVIDRDGGGASAFERKVARIWVIAVLVAAAVGFTAWMAVTRDPSRAIAVCIGLLVVTCPCAFGIAMPLGQEIVLAKLRKEGLLVRSSRFLERAATIRRIVFDKTGTLTSGELTVTSAGALDGLTPEERRVAYNLAARSSHPRAAAVRTAVPAGDQRYDASIVAVESAGRGVAAAIDGATYRLGSISFVSPAEREAGRCADVCFGVDGRLLASFDVEERLRSDAREEIAELRALGLEVSMLSGDRQDRADAAARAAGIDPGSVLAEKTPAEKAAFIRSIDRGDTLMIGDGINDSLAVVAAHCSGTPASGRTFLAARADFYLLASGLRPVRLAWLGARALRRVTRRNLQLSLAYNALAVGLAYAGLMSPLVCAVFMPVSSLATILHTTRSLGREGALWTS